MEGSLWSHPELRVARASAHREELALEHCSTVGQGSTFCGPEMSWSFYFSVRTFITQTPSFWTQKDTIGILSIAVFESSFVSVFLCTCCVLPAVCFYKTRFPLCFYKTRFPPVDAPLQMTQHHPLKNTLGFSHKNQPLTLPSGLEL